jgi:uncharacterized integral membrane protein
MTTTRPSGEQERERLTPAARRERVRLVFALGVGAVVAAFALLNLDSVKVHWIVTSGGTPLIVVIAVSFALGMLADRILLLRSRRRRRARGEPAPQD